MDCTPQLHINLTCGQHLVKYSTVVLNFPQDNRTKTPSIELERNLGWGCGWGWDENRRREEYRKDPFFDELKTALRKEWSLWVAREGPEMRFSRSLFNALAHHINHFMMATLVFIDENWWMYR